MKKCFFKKYLSYLSIFLFVIPVFAFGQTNNILNQIVPSDTGGFGSQPLSQLLNQLFWIGLIAAVVLSLVMIIRGGVEYMTIDSISGKENGKNRIQAALGGLLLAFSAILILNTINPGLTKLSIRFEQLKTIQATRVEGEILNSVNQFSGLSNEELQNIIASGKIPTNISPTAQAILAQAIASVNTLQTGTIDNTNGGRLACAAAVNKIVELATGSQVGGGLSTASMYTALQNNPKYVLVPGGTQNAQPGDIIISPTSGNATGHVGFVATQGATSIISNSSSQKQVAQNHSASSWNNTYGGKGLPVYIYRPL